MNEDHDDDWVDLLQGPLDGIREAARLLESTGVSPRVTPVPGG